MDVHDNAGTTPRSRMMMVERLDAGGGRRQDRAQMAWPVCGGRVAGLADRSSRPLYCPSRLDGAAEVEIERSRRERLSDQASGLPGT